MHDEPHSLNGSDEVSLDRVEAQRSASTQSQAAENPISGNQNIHVVGSITSSLLVSGNGNQITINTGPQDIASPAVGEATFNLLSSQIETLSAELSEEKAVQLEEFREQFREGAMERAYESVHQLYHSPNWVTLSTTVRASVLRGLAVMTLSLKAKSGVAEAMAFATDAKSTKQSPEDPTLDARIAVVAEDNEAALNKLGEPTTLDSYNLHLALLLETGRLEAAMHAFQHPPSGITFDAETHRLLALALLAQRNMVGAREQISKALALRPRRQNIRFCAAIINYFSALSELAVPTFLIPFPRPMNLSMVRSDAASQELLAKAAEEFERIAECGSRSDEERRRLETWRLACIANLPNRVEDAIQFCKDVLAADPGNTHVLAWVLFRQYALDLSSSRQALETLLAGSDRKRDLALLEDVLVLIGVYLKDEYYSEALDLLDRKNEAFSEADQLDFWRYWRGQTLVAMGQPEDGLDEAERIIDPMQRRPLLITALIAIANRNGDWQPVIAHLEESCASGDKHSLLLLCDLKAQLGDWAYVADRADLYCNTLGTASAVRIAVAASWYAKRPSQCLRLLNEYLPLFGNGALPSDLRRLRINCLVYSSIRDALVEAEALVQEDRTVNNLMLLMDVRLTKGDLVGLELTARELLSRNDVTTEQYLRAAHLVRLNNPLLARKLWLRAADSAGDSAELTAFAVNLAASLGLESGSLMQRMFEYANQGQGPMRPVDMEQMLEMMRQATEQQIQRQQLYAAAGVPIHLAAKNGLAAVLHGLAEWNRTAASDKRHHLMIRHGGRTLLPVNYKEITPNWRLHCDISSLLIAHELGVLEKIESRFKPLKISSHSVTALIAQREKLKPHQKSQLDHSQTLLKMVNSDRVLVLDAELSIKSQAELRDIFANGYSKASNGVRSVEDLEHAEDGIYADPTKLEGQLGPIRLEMFAAAVASGGFAATFLPLPCYATTKMTPLITPEVLQGHLVNCRAIADSLLGHQRITQEQHEMAVKALGTEGLSHSVVTPLLDTQLFLTEEIAGVLIEAQLFERVCNNFEVVVSSGSVAECNELVSYYERLAAVENWVNELIARISDGLDEGIYEFITIPDERIAQRDDAEERTNYDFRSTLDLFLFTPEKWDVIWVDDRAFNKYAVRSDEHVAAPVVGIQEILLALRAQGDLDEHSYYQLLLKMRESDFRYLPMDADEIVYHLRRAGTENGRVKETPALVSIRRYYASCVLDKDFLQTALTADGSPNPHSEVLFIIQTINNTADAIARVWQGATYSAETAMAQADWILNSLYTGSFGCSSLRPDTTPSSEIFTAPAIIGLDICNLIMRGIGMHGNPFLDSDVCQRRNEYFTWLTSRVLDRAYASDPGVIRAIAVEMRERFAMLKARSLESGTDELFVRAFVGKFFWIYRI